MSPNSTGRVPAALKRSLQSQDWRERRRAVLGLSDADSGSAAPLLEATLGDPSDDVRHAAVVVIGRLQLRGFHDEVLKPRILGSPDANLRWAAVSTLGRLADTRDIIPLTRMLLDEDWLVRNEARKVLAEAVDRLGEDEDDGDAVDTLIHLLFLENETLRPLVIRNLCRHGSRALPALREALNEPSPAMLAGVVRVLGLLGDRHSLVRLIELSRSDDRRVRRAVAEALGLLGGRDAARTLVRMLAVQQNEVCEAAEQSLLQLGAESLPPILELLQHEDCTRLRVRCIRVLGHLRLPEALPALRAGLRSSYYRVRQATIQALVAYGPAITDQLLPGLKVAAPDVQPLLVQLQREPSQEGQLRLLRVIGETGNHAAVPFIKDLRGGSMGEDGLLLRRTANQALFQLGCASWERYCLLAVLGQVAGVEHAEDLIPSLDHPSYYVRNRAVRSLARFSTPEVGRALARTAGNDPRYFVRRTALQVLGGLNVDKGLLYRTAHAALQDNAPGVRVEAVRVLARLVNDKAVPALIEGLLDEVWSVREACETALRNFPAKAVKPLVRLLDEEREFIRLRAARLLGELGDPGAVPALQRQLKKEAPGTRVHDALLRSVHRLLA
ncbi:MAG: HEAT repeat domain-containing protein [Candidatus Delongbacteria bacterium]